MALGACTDDILWSFTLVDILVDTIKLIFVVRGAKTLHY